MSKQSLLEVTILSPPETQRNPSAVPRQGTAIHTRKQASVLEESKRKLFPCVLFTPVRSRIPSLGAGTPSSSCFKERGCFGVGRAWKE